MLELHLASKKKLIKPFTTIADTPDNGTKVGTYGVDFSTAFIAGHTSNDAGTVVVYTYTSYGLIRTTTGYYQGTERFGSYECKIVNRTGEYILYNGGIRKYNITSGKWDIFVTSVPISGYGYGCGSPDGTLWTKRPGDNMQSDTIMVNTRRGYTEVTTVDGLHSLISNDNKRVLFGRRGNIRISYGDTITNSTACMRLYNVDTDGTTTVKSFTDRTGHFAADGDFKQLFEYRFTNNTWYAYDGSDDFTTVLTSDYTSGLPNMSSTVEREIWFVLSADGKTMVILRNITIYVYRRPSTTTGGWVLIRGYYDAFYLGYSNNNFWPSVNTDGTVVISPYDHPKIGTRVYHIT